MQTNPNIARQILSSALALKDREAANAVILDHTRKVSTRRILAWESETPPNMDTSSYLELVRRLLSRPAAGYEYLFEIRLSADDVDLDGKLIGAAREVEEAAQRLELKTRLSRKSNGLFTRASMKRDLDGMWADPVDYLPGYEEWQFLEIGRFGYRGAAPVAAHRERRVFELDVQAAREALLTAASIASTAPSTTAILSTIHTGIDQPLSTVIGNLEDFERAVTAILVNGDSHSPILSVRLSRDDFKSCKPCNKDSRLRGISAQVWTLAGDLGLKVRLRRQNNGLCTRKTWARDADGLYEHPMEKLEGYEEWWAIVISKPSI